LKFFKYKASSEMKGLFYFLGVRAGFRYSLPDGTVWRAQTNRSIPNAKRTLR